MCNRTERKRDLQTCLVPGVFSSFRGFIVFLALVFVFAIAFVPASNISRVRALSLALSSFRCHMLSLSHVHYLCLVSGLSWLCLVPSLVVRVSDPICLNAFRSQCFQQ